MVTARDVATRAGTSTAVVSYVFNDGPRGVSPATREKVLAAAAELNYRPNALARALSFGRSSSIGLLVPDIANPFFGELARAVEDAAHLRRHLLLIGDAGLDAEQERKNVAAFVERRMDSVVMVAMLDEPELEPLHRAGIQVVALHPIAPGSGASSVTIDYAAAAHAATDHLLGHGYRALGLLNGPSDSPGSRQHRSGFRGALAQAQDAVGTERRSETTRADAAEVAATWLSGHDRPRAVYAATDEQAYGVLSAAHALGLRVPRDLAVLGLDGTAHSAYAVPPLATVRQPIRRIAERAVELLLDERAPAEEREPVHELLDHALIPRESCGCADAAT